MRASKGLSTLFIKLITGLIKKKPVKANCAPIEQFTLHTHKFGNWVWSWYYEKPPLKNEYVTTDLKPLCPVCNSGLISLSDNFSSSKCEECNKEFHNITFWVGADEIKESITQMLKNGEQ